jgi:threonine synthase
MNYYSTNRQSPHVNLREAVVKSLAPDSGLYMPERIPVMPPSFFDRIENKSFQEISYDIALAFFGEDIDKEALRQIVYDTLSFDVPLHEVSRDIYSLELYYGPTLAFKDIGSRFMARLLSYFTQENGRERADILVATTGDTGGAVANGFLGVDGVHVHVLYPGGMVSDIQEKQFTTLGCNVTALEVDGTFDDCQRLVKTAFVDNELKGRLNLTSANSINVARFLPQIFYYFHACAQWKKMNPRKKTELVFSIPSGNFGNITAASFARRMGLPVKRLIAANNRNDVFFDFLRTGQYRPRPSVATLANAMDVGDPSNFARVLDLFDHSHEAVCRHIRGARFDDRQIAETISALYKETGYLMDPHGACGYAALKEGLENDEAGIFLETAHPAKFKEIVEKIIGAEIEMPGQLASFMQGEKQTVPLSSRYEDFKAYLMAC